LEIWRNIAARECVQAVFHFGKTLEAVTTNLSDIPSLTTEETHKQKRQARKLFDRSFPNIVQNRDGICHVAQNMLTLAAVTKHINDGLLSGGKLNGRELLVTKDGREPLSN
jgi:hypothetical protein